MGKGIRLDIATVERGLCGSRTEAQELIKKGVVFVDGVCVTKPVKQVTDVTVIDVRGKREFVSRGGEKMLGLLKDLYQNDTEIKKNIHNTVVLDVGSSTGGFSDCLLQQGSIRIDAVDVGTSQLHISLRDDTRMTVYENQDIRTFVSQNMYDIIVVDVSFISIVDIIESLIRLGTKNKTQYVVLIKPQFEVGKGNTKKGIVKDEILVEGILKKIKDKVMLYGLHDIHIFKSCIQGGDGNQEYFLCAKK